MSHPHIVAASIYVCVFVCAGWAGIANVASSAEKDEEISGEDCGRILEQIAAATKANFEALKTWEVDWESEVKLFSPARRGEVAHVSVEHARLTNLVDLTGNKLQTKYEPTSGTEYLNPETAEPIKRKAGRGYWLTSVLTPEHFLTCDANATQQNVDGFPAINDLRQAATTRAIFRRASREFAKEDRLRVIDPRNFFRCQSVKPWEYADTLAKKLLAPNAPKNGSEGVRSDIRIRKTSLEGHPLYTLVLTLRRHPVARGKGGSEGSITEITFDSRFGLNQTLWRKTSIGRGIEEERAFEFRRVGEVFVPSRMSATFFGTENAGTKLPVSSESLVAGKIKVNEPIDPKAFDISAFGLKYGDRLYDEIERELTFFDGTKMVPSDEFEYKKPPTN